MTPTAKARLTATFALLTVILGGLGQAIQDRIVITGDATTTALNAMTRPGVLWAGFAIYMVELACALVATSTLYELLRPAGTAMARLGVLFSVTGVTVKVVSRFFYVFPLLIMDGSGVGSALTGDQLRVLAHLFFRLNAYGAGFAMPFLGAYAVCSGWLVTRSTFLPKWIGWLGMAGGIGWLTFFVPPIGLRLFPIVILLALLGTIAKVGWFLIKGVDDAAWETQAATEARSRWA